MVKFRVLVILGASTLFSSMTMAKSIEVCVIPLRDIVVREARMFVGSLQHMFVRGADGTGLNFEPENPMEFLDGKARIGLRNYPNATCSPVFTTENDGDYHVAWRAILAAYNNAATTYRYSVADKNCQFVTRKILCDLGYTLPAEISEILGGQTACSIQ